MKSQLTDSESSIEELVYFVAFMPDLEFYGSNGVWRVELVGVDKLFMELNLGIDSIMWC